MIDITSRDNELESRVTKRNVFKRVEYIILTDTKTKKIMVIIDERRGTVRLNILNVNNLQDNIDVIMEDRYWEQFEEYFKAIERVVKKDFNVESLENLAENLENDVIKRDVYYIHNNVNFSVEEKRVKYENGIIVYPTGIENFSNVLNEDVGVNVISKAFLVHGYLMLEGVDLND